MRHQMIVAHTIKMSTQAKGTFRKPEKIGMKSRFAARLMPNGIPTTQDTLPLNDCTKTNPKLTRMIGYRIVQIRLMVAGAGVHDGFVNELYHSIQVMCP